MSSAPDMNAQMDSKLVDSLLTVNQLSYRMPPAINIANKVTHTIQYSTRRHTTPSTCTATFHAPPPQRYTYHHSPLPFSKTTIRAICTN